MHLYHAVKCSVEQNSIGDNGVGTYNRHISSNNGNNHPYNSRSNGNKQPKVQSSTANKSTITHELVGTCHKPNQTSLLTCKLA